MLAPFSGPWLVGTTKVYPGPGADIVMESIALKTRTTGQEMKSRVTSSIQSMRVLEFTLE